MITAQVVRTLHQRLGAGNPLTDGKNPEFSVPMPALKLAAKHVRVLTVDGLGFHEPEIVT